MITRIMQKQVKLRFYLSLLGGALIIYVVISSFQALVQTQW